MPHLPPTRRNSTPCAAASKTLKKDLSGAEEDRSEASDGLRASERGVSEANRVLRNIGAQQQAARADLQRVGQRSRLLEATIAAQQRELGRCWRCATSPASRTT